MSSRTHCLAYLTPPPKTSTWSLPILSGFRGKRWSSLFLLPYFLASCIIPSLSLTLLPKIHNPELENSVIGFTIYSNHSHLLLPLLYFLFLSCLLLPCPAGMMASATSVLLHPVKSRPSSALGIHTLGLLHANCPSCQLLWKETGSSNQAALLPNQSARQMPLSFARHSLPPSPWIPFPFLLAYPGSSRPYKKKYYSFYCLAMAILIINYCDYSPSDRRPSRLGVGTMY